MGMALKADVIEACKYQGTEKPIDLVHLSKLTMGDRALEVEVLKMFLAQIPHYLEMMKSSRNDNEVYRAAHTVKGAARNVGAFQLAELADDAEETGVFSIKEIVSELSRITEYVSTISDES